jgi:hypothetical protein
MFTVEAAFDSYQGRPRERKKMEEMDEKAKQKRPWIAFAFWCARDTLETWPNPFLSALAAKRKSSLNPDTP